MKNKAVFLAGAGVGYVLGTRAGRQQFEALKAKAASLWNDPRVQDKVSTVEAQAAQFAKEQGSTLLDKATDAVKSAASSAGLTGHGAHTDDAATPGPGSTDTSYPSNGYAGGEDYVTPDPRTTDTGTPRGF